MGPRTYWTPGMVLPESATDQLRETPTALKHHHIVSRAFFAGQGHTGVLVSQWNGREWAVWRVDVYGNPVLFDVAPDQSAVEPMFLSLTKEYFPPQSGD